MTDRNRGRAQRRARAERRADERAEQIAQLSLADRLERARVVRVRTNGVRIQLEERQVRVEAKTARLIGYFETLDRLVSEYRAKLIADRNPAALADFEDGVRELAAIRDTVDVFLATTLPIMREEYAAALAEEAATWREVLRLEALQRLGSAIPDYESGMVGLDDRLEAAIRKLSAATADDQQKVTIQ